MDRRMPARQNKTPDDEADKTSTLSDSPRRRRERMAVTTPGVDSAPDEPPAEPGQAEPGTANNAALLDKQQQRLVIELIAKFNFSRVVREELAEIDPDFPYMSDQAINYYRVRIQQGKYPWVKQYLKDYTRRGLGRRETRVALLQRELNELMRIPTVETIIVRSPTGEQQIIYQERTDAIKLRLAILKQIAEEYGGVKGGVLVDPDDLPDDGPSATIRSAVAEQARTDLALALAVLAEAKASMDAADRGSERPPQEPT